MRRNTASSHWIIRLSLLLVVALFAAACAGGESESETEGGTNTDEDAGTPVTGGKAIFGLEAETTNGWCLPEGQLAIAGIQVARSIYDTLTVPDGEGNFVPFLAKSVTPNADATEWTIELREGIKFHDGSDLTADVVKNNLDAFRGQYPGRTSLLFSFVLSDIAAVNASGPLTVTITTKRPWAALPAFLYSSGRMGISAQAQLDNVDNCATEMVGTGPFKLVEWKVNDHLSLERNPDYWRTDENGTKLPYLDELEFRPITEAQQRKNALESGEIDAFHSSSATESLIIEELRTMAEDGEINLTESDKFGEVGNLMLNASKPPFDNPLARKAAALALNREEANEILANNIPTLANGPFTPGAMGYLEDTGFETGNLDEAKALVAQYEDETGTTLEVQISSPPSPELQRLVELTKGYFEAAGMTVTTTTFEQSQLINTAIGRNYQAITWRNYPVLDPDANYVWWYGNGNPVNFMGFDDPEVNDLLDRGRVETDPAARKDIYEDLNKELNKENYMLWSSWVLWAIPMDADLHGAIGARPPEGGEDYPGFALGLDLALMWREQ